MISWAHRLDQNHGTIVHELEKLGFATLPLHSLGHGWPDVLVSDPTDMWLLEIKKPRTPGDEDPRPGRLSKKQLDFHARWRGKPIVVAHSTEEFLAKIGRPIVSTATA